MKIQCSCGAMYEIDLVPEMADQSIQFVCSACGLDSSDFVNDLIRRELAQNPAPSPAPTAAPVGMLLEEPGPPPAPRAPTRVHLASAPAGGAPAAAPAAALDENPPMCLKHGGELATGKCFVCSKPICPKCMELFGYLCSPLCKAKADSHGLRVPVYAQQRSVVEAQLWSKVVRISTVAAVVIVLLVGVWIWYAWFGSIPKRMFFVRFPERSYSGQSYICGQDNQQIVFLHGGTLARHDMKLNKELWSRDLIDHKAIRAEAANDIKEMEQARTRAQQEYPDALDFYSRIPTLDELTRRLERWAAAELALFVRGSNVWILTDTNLVRYDWDKGDPATVVPFTMRYSDVSVRADELLLVENRSNAPAVTHINLYTCDSRVDDFGIPLPTNVAAVATGLAAKNPGESGGAGLPIKPGQDMGKPMDPAKVAEQARHLPLPARIALPAVLASSMNQERAMAEMAETARKKSTLQRERGEHVEFVPAREGYVQLGVKLVQTHVVERNAMKPASGQSALDGAPTVANNAEAANEILNEMQRMRGGGTVTEDLSKFHVNIRNPGETNGWSGDVIGYPTLFPLQTVNVLACRKSIIVLDKSHNKMWDATLSYDVDGYDQSNLDPDNAPYGQGPCVERGKVLYIVDEGVLTAFDLATGNVRWRLPSVGIEGLFFDDKDKMYVNTTTAGLDRLKYSRQIDISRFESEVVLKIDCRNGKIIWRGEPGGAVNYVSGKFVYVAMINQPWEDEDNPFPDTGFEQKSYTRIRRLNPRSGSVMWEHFEPRAAVDVKFDKNVIRLVFKKEVEVLKCLTF